jgi:WD40 repeat protein
VRLWSLAPDGCFQKGMLQSRSEEVRALAFSSDGQTLAYATSNRHVWLFDVSAGDPQLKDHLQIDAGRGGKSSKGGRTPEPHLDQIRSLAFAQDDKTLAVGVGPSVRLFDLGTGQATALAGHAGEVLAVAISPSGKQVASASADGTVRLWNPRAFWNKTLETLKAPTVSCIAYSSDGRFFALGERERSFQVWDVAADPPEPKIWEQACRSGMLFVQFQPSGDRLLTVEEQGHVGVWDLSTGACVEDWNVPLTKAYSFALSTDGRYLATGNIDGTVQVFRIAAKRDAPPKGSSAKMPALRGQ